MPGWPTPPSAGVSRGRVSAGRPPAVAAPGPHRQRRDLDGLDAELLDLELSTAVAGRAHRKRAAAPPVWVRFLGTHDAAAARCRRAARQLRRPRLPGVLGRHAADPGPSRDAGHCDPKPGEDVAGRELVAGDEDALPQGFVDVDRGLERIAGRAGPRARRPRRGAGPGSRPCPARIPRANPSQPRSGRAARRSRNLDRSRVVSRAFRATGCARPPVGGARVDHRAVGGRPRTRTRAPR